MGKKPLIAWTIETAMQCKRLSRVVVSTDDPKIASAAKEHGADVPFMRPTEIAQDSTPGIEPVLHAIDLLPEFDWLLLLQPTSPLRNTSDIEGIINLCHNSNAESAVSLTEAPVHPFWTYQIKDKRIFPFYEKSFVSCRQDLPSAFSINGALYLSKVERLKKLKNFISEDTLGYIMPKERSIDIDDELDFRIVQNLISNTPKFKP